MAERHLIGLLLGAEEDWPSVFEELAARVGPITWRGERHELATERISIGPFDLRARPRHALVIDRLAHWYYVPREWLKKVALMDDIYLLNNPFTFQSMEKHAAYCGMLRLGLKVPETWLIPHKRPPVDDRFAYTASKYNTPFDLPEIARRIGYPLYMKPFDGGAWVGVTRIANEAELVARYEESGRRLMHLQAAVDFDVFARSLTIGAETLVVRFDPGRPMYDRYQVAHGFLAPETGWEVETIGRLVNAFFRWEFNSCETLVRGDEVFPIDYANASPDVSITSLHYYFPWAMRTLLKWCAFCTVTRRAMNVNQDSRPYHAFADRDDLAYDEKLASYRALAEEYFQTEAYEEFCAEALPHVDELVVDYVESRAFDDLLVRTVTDTFPAHEHERFVPHYRGLLEAWVGDQRAAATA